MLLPTFVKVLQVAEFPISAERGCIKIKASENEWCYITKFFNRINCSKGELGDNKGLYVQLEDNKTTTIAVQYSNSITTLSSVVTTKQLEEFVDWWALYS